MTRLVTVGIVQWPEGLEAHGEQWERIAEEVAGVRPDILVTNEMPFGPWLADADRYDADAAGQSMAVHDAALKQLAELQAGAVVSSRPVSNANAFANDKLANEAFVLEGGHYRLIHQKHYFPQEPGFFEHTWFEPEVRGFDCVDIRTPAGTVRAGVLLCTELFFNERARGYGKHGAHLVLNPRASGVVHSRWHAAGAMAAIVSGAYFASSNRVGQSGLGQEFGGRGFAMSPVGEPIAHTDDATRMQVIEIDLDVAEAQKHVYPCYVLG